MTVFKFLIGIAWIVLIGCHQPGDRISQEKGYSADIGDIPFDPNLDDKAFILCNESNVIQRRNALRYEGGRIALEKAVHERFNFQNEFSTYSGYIMARFVMNCHDERGRFRVSAMDFDFSSQPCPAILESHLLAVVKGLNAWSHRYEKDNDHDCTKYINFKIKDGKIEGILL